MKNTRILIIGFGGHVTKNILPVLVDLKAVDIAGVVVRSKSKYEALANQAGLKLFTIDEVEFTSFEFVYIATPISSHFSLCKFFLEAEKNVICEKPLVRTKLELEFLKELAERNSVELHEVNIYCHHMQMKHVRNYIKQNHSKLEFANIVFSIPHLKKDDIRYSRKLGGGALYDLGFYPISLCLDLFGRPSKIQSYMHSQAGYEVDTLCGAFFQYENLVVCLRFGMGLHYQNELELFANDKRVNYQRIFSKPASFETAEISYVGQHQERKIIGADDQIRNLFNAIIDGSYSHTLANTMAVVEVMELFNSQQSSGPSIPQLS